MFTLQSGRTSPAARSGRPWREHHGTQWHPFQGVFYLRFTSIYWVYAQMRRLVSIICSTRSRAFCGEAILAGRVRYTRYATNGENPCDFWQLACLAQARQDPERGGSESRNRRIARQKRLRALLTQLSCSARGSSLNPWATAARHSRPSEPTQLLA